MHPGIIHYHQAHPDAAFIGKIVEKDLNCDLLIVIGTSLKVEGVKRIVKRFSSSNNVKGKRFLVNLTKPTKEWETVFDYFFEGDCNQFVKVLDSKFVKEKSNVNNESINYTSDLEIVKEKSNVNNESINYTSDLEIVKEKSNVNNESINYTSDREIVKEKSNVNNESINYTSDREIDLNNVNKSYVVENKNIQIKINKLNKIEKTNDTVFTEVTTNNEILIENKMEKKIYEEKNIEMLEKPLNDKNNIVTTMRRISLSKIDNINEFNEDNIKKMSYSINEKYDENLSKKNEITNPHIYIKLDKLSGVFTKKENIIMPILDEVLATSKNADVEEILDIN